MLADRGSSPRMRGTPLLRMLLIVVAGIIPADAGNTTWATSGSMTTRDHPRGCGEHRPRSGLPKRGQGSSPRMRGTPSGVTSHPEPIGIIPADAGNTCHPHPHRVSAGDHPRGCGEHRPSMCRRPAPIRIIPADAGNTTAAAMGLTADRDHPRGCGEHGQSEVETGRRAGSSPRMRGTPSHSGPVASPDGIIPADAGNT